MKRFFYAMLAVAATLTVFSCKEELVDENGQGPVVIDDNTVVFSLMSGASTRSASTGTGSFVEALIPMGDPVDGYEFYLEETVTDLDAVAYSPETRGTPVYTENFADMYTGFYGAVYSATGTTLSSTPVAPDGEFYKNMDVWERKFTTPIWEGNDLLYFFLRTPKTIPGLGESGITYRLANNGRCITEFDYTVPLNAEDQEEILITGRSVTHEEARQPIPVLFHHALTGVKFATDNDNSDADCKTYITKVEFPRALFRSAHIRITSTWENGKWEDDADIHSSTQTDVYNVSSGVQLKNNEVFTLNLADSDIVDFATGGSFEHNGKYPDSFAAAGNLNNLNDTDASKTFWLIPQRMNNNIVMDVTFHVVSGGKDSGPITRRIEIGKALTNNTYWRAGQIRTFTLKANLMDVDITDEVNGFEKTKVKITNTGNVDAFIRAHITANWFGYAGTNYGVAIGYKSQTSGEFVDIWRMETPTTSNYGTFEGLPGEGWAIGADGFFYYTEMVPAGKQIPSPLFTKYSVSGSNIPPEVWYMDNNNVKHQFTGVELVMEIPVQAISALQADGTAWEKYQDAWGAVGVTGLPE